MPVWPRGSSRSRPAADQTHMAVTGRTPYFEGLAEEIDLAQRGYSRDHRGDCKQVILALVLSLTRQEM